MDWNIRLVNCPSRNGGDDSFSFKDVYYDDDGNAEGYCDAFLGGDDIGEVQELLMRLHTALQQPVLHENDFKE
jgi:hypothetical protein